MRQLLKNMTILDVVPCADIHPAEESGDGIGDELDGDFIIYIPNEINNGSRRHLPLLPDTGTILVVTDDITAVYAKAARLKEISGVVEILETGLTIFEAKRIFEKLINGMIRILYADVECVLVNDFINLIQTVDLKNFIILNAHNAVQNTETCDAGGGKAKDYYAHLPVLKEVFPEIPVVAVCPLEFRVLEKHMIAALALSKVNVVSLEDESITPPCSVDSDSVDISTPVIRGGDETDQLTKPESYLLEDTACNIGFNTEETRATRFWVGLKTGMESMLPDYIRANHPDKKGIIFVNSRNKADKTAAFMTEAGINCISLHKGLSREEIEKGMLRFQMEKQAVLTALMGNAPVIDHVALNFVVHLGIPKSIKAYEKDLHLTGDMPAEAMLFYDLSDITKGLMRIKSEEDKANLIEMFSIIESTGCRNRVFVLKTKGINEKKCGICDVCVNGTETYDATEAAVQALDAVKQSKERFGAIHLSKILTGKITEKIKWYGHDRLNFFGKGDSLSQKKWKSIFRKLLLNHYLATDMERKGGFFKTPKGEAALSGDAPIILIKDGKHKLPPAKEIKPVIEEKDLNKPFSSGETPLLPPLKKSAAHIVVSNFHRDLEKKRDGILHAFGIHEAERAEIEKAFRKGEKIGRDDIGYVYHELDGKFGKDLLRCVHYQYQMKKNPLRRALNGYAKQLVVLSAARLSGHYHIAGKELVDGTYGSWIRPVEATKQNGLGLADILLQEGKLPKVFDIMSIAFKTPGHDGMFTENHVIDESVPWKKNGVLSHKEVDELTDDAESIWLNGFNSKNGFNDLIPADLFRKNVFNSLLFIKPENPLLSITEREKDSGGPHYNGSQLLTAEFSFKGMEYCLEIADMETENLYHAAQAGKYPFSGSRTYFTVVLSEPYYGYCRKTVSGVYSVP